MKQMIFDGSNIVGSLLWQALKLLEILFLIWLFVKNGKFNRLSKTIANVHIVIKKLIHMDECYVATEHNRYMLNS